MSDIYARADRVTSIDTRFSYSHVICGNEAFPESAISDPIADLEVWDEWRSGLRYFPYPGRYSKLGISRQEDKISSSSSVGVLGEIMTGLFAQVGVSPWVLVRVVRRWPDFIFAHGDKTYSFVESKALHSETLAVIMALQSRVLNKHLSEAAADTVQQLNSDPFGKVWYAFTHVVSITPMILDVTFLELNVPSIRRQRHHVKAMPQAVVDGLAERAINQAAAMLVPEELADLELQPKRRSLDVPRQIERHAEQQLGELLRDAGAEVSDNEDRNAVQLAIQKFISQLEKKRWNRPRDDEAIGRRFLEAKEQAVEGRLSKLRSVAENWLLMADLPSDQRTGIVAQWNTNWERASAPMGRA